jgi:acetyltransferase-like isoleucine patch superfamily enzyme
MHKNVVLGKNCLIQENVLLGIPSREYLDKDQSTWPPTKIGDNAILRSGTIIYCDVVIGKKFQTGHSVLVREKTKIGDNVLLGSYSIVDGLTEIGSHVSIQSSVYIPLNTVIGDKVFIGPKAVLTNDKYPLRKKERLKGPILRRGVSVGANATLLPGIEIGEGAMIAAGAVVTKDIPPWKLAIGNPARIKDLPEELKVVNLVED